jgi:hypothetical protein
MSTAQVTKRITEAPPRLRDKFIGAYYLLTVVTGVFVLFFHGRLAFAADLGAGAFYLIVTAFFYRMSAAANRSNRR